MAGVSKTITGIAIMKLIQDGKLEIDSKVFGTGGILGITYGTQPYGTNITNITVKELLQHTCGGWGELEEDPIDQNQTLDNDEFLSWVLNTKPLSHVPGTTYDYSNTGYFILGRIIEKISGKSYIDYLTKDLFTSLGIKTLDRAGTTENDRKENEVAYYGQGSDAPNVYSIDFSRRDADGGLMISATDLLRIVDAVDGFDTRPDILSAATIIIFTLPSGAAPLSPVYACGIGKYNDYWYNYGSLPGTYTGFVRLDNGMSATLLLNSRYDITNSQYLQFTYDMQDVMLVPLHDNSIKWQDVDQF